MKNTRHCSLRGESGYDSCSFTNSFIFFHLCYKLLYSTCFFLCHSGKSWLVQFWLSPSCQENAASSLRSKESLQLSRSPALSCNPQCSCADAGKATTSFLLEILSDSTRGLSSTSTFRVFPAILSYHWLSRGRLPLRSPTYFPASCSIYVSTHNTPPVPLTRNLDSQRTGKPSKGKGQTNSHDSSADVMLTWGKGMLPYVCRLIISAEPLLHAHTHTQSSLKSPKGVSETKVVYLTSRIGILYTGCRLVDVKQ